MHSLLRNRRRSSCSIRFRWCVFCFDTAGAFFCIPSQQASASRRCRRCPLRSDTQVLYLVASVQQAFGSVAACFWYFVAAGVSCCGVWTILLLIAMFKSIFRSNSRLKHTVCVGLPTLTCRYQSSFLSPRWPLPGSPADLHLGLTVAF